MAQALRVLLVGGPMYDPLYTRLAQFEADVEADVEVVAALAHPDLNERIEKEFGSGTARYDLTSTHTKYAPSQRQWLTPLDDDLDGSDLEHFTPRTLDLARIEGSLYGVPRNLDVKLLYHRTDLVPEPPPSWERLLEEASDAALLSPKHERYPAVEDAIWQGIREALLGINSVEEALADIERVARRAAEGAS